MTTSEVKGGRVYQSHSDSFPLTTIVPWTPRNQTLGVLPLKNVIDHLHASKISNFGQVQSPDEFGSRDDRVRLFLVYRLPTSAQQDKALRSVRVA